MRRLFNSKTFTSITLTKGSYTVSILMNSIQLLDQLFYINYKLKFINLDKYFQKMGFANFIKEDSLLSYVRNNKRDISYYSVNVVGQKIINSNFKTSREIDTEAILNYAKTHYQFSFDQEIDQTLIYKRDHLRLHLRTLNFSTPECSKVMCSIYLFESLETSTNREIRIKPLQFS